MERDDKLQGVYWYDLLHSPGMVDRPIWGPPPKEAACGGPLEMLKVVRKWDLRLPADCERAGNSIQKRSPLVVGQRAKWPDSTEYLTHSLKCYCS